MTDEAYKYPLVEESVLTKLASAQLNFSTIVSEEQGMVLMSADGTIQACNAACDRILGLTLQQLVGWNIVDIPWLVIHEDGSPFTSQTYPSMVALRTGKPCVNMVMGFYKPDGELLWLLVNALPLFATSNTAPLAVVNTFTDITIAKCTDVQPPEERYRSIASLLQHEQQARREAEEASRIKDEFLAIVSHELRSPLNAMLGWVKLLRKQSLNEATTAKALEVIERNALVQNQLIEDLLDISRINSGKVRLQLCPVNLAQVVKTAIDTAILSANTKSVQLESSLDANVMVMGDSERLQQIVGNLLSNAIKFTACSGRVEVRLSAQGCRELGVGCREKTPSHTPSNYAQITVSDTGVGISPEFLPHVFERFWQADTVSTNKQQGLGLGLAIVRNLVELHGGKVQVESPGVGLGATFTVRLPLL